MSPIGFGILSSTIPIAISTLIQNDKDCSRLFSFNGLFLKKKQTKFAIIRIDLETSTVD
jgi:hypothetical protein